MLLRRFMKGSRVPPLLGAVAILLYASVAPGFDLADVAAKAQKLAAESFRDSGNEVPRWLSEITYDEWRDIRFRPDDTLWRAQKLPFQVQFFHPGLYYNRIVAVNVVDGKTVRPLPFAPSQFDYGRNTFASKVPQNLGYAGFRIHAPIKTPKYFDEVIVFLGASYFRAVGKRQVFGISARGLAVNTALSSGEEFPFFKEFWLVTPSSKAKQLTLYALLDSPSVTGAYQFVVRPGEQTVVDVDARLYVRDDVKKLGLAPLTSMFFHGENSARQFEDFRPEAHDSDGLLLSFDSGEWLWRPLDNPHALHVSALKMTDPQGFGLIQRDRDFKSYQDLETHAELRPSVWVTPKGKWGEGHVEVVEIPTKTDTNDNIVVFWVPAKSPHPGDLVATAYSMTWYDDDATKPPNGRVVATRRDGGNRDEVHRFVIDFDSKELEKIPADEILRGVVSLASGEDSAEIIDQQVVKNPVTGGWRLSFQVRPKQRDPIELRAFLDKGGRTLTETWSYAILP